MPANQYFDWTGSASRFVRFDTVRAGDANAALDLVTAGLSAVAADVLRAIKLPVGTAVDQVVTQTALQRSNRLLSFDVNGNLAAILGAFTYRGDWVTATAYNARDAFRDPTSKNIYFVAVDHTAGVLASDIAAGRDVLSINVADVEAAKTAAQTSAASAASSASTATTQAGLATTNGAAQVALAANQVALAANQVALATTQATAAGNSAKAANATAFVSGETVAKGDARYSLIDLQSYRAATAGVRTTDPSLDAVNWAPLNAITITAYATFLKFA